MITGKTLIEWGFDPAGAGKWFGAAIVMANRLRDEGYGDDSIRGALRRSLPVPPPEMPLRTNQIPFSVFLEPETADEHENLAKVVQAMDDLVRTPTVEKAVVMPDACPAGIIPVGGVVATKDAIHPGFHSADVCCSMSMTVFKRGDDPKKLLDVAQKITHFGPGGRKSGFVMPPWLRAGMDENRFLAKRDSKYGDIGDSNLGTQGDGNHFLFVGRLRSTGQLAMVTHHGSRGIGALLYKRGMEIAKRHTKIVSPRTPEAASWIDANSDEGRAYWDALQLVREWTRLNHDLIHTAIQTEMGNAIADQFWNEHNFVFRRDDGLFYHAKGATPSFKGFSASDDGRTLIPLNMAEPILIATHRDNPDALGFSPHGAGRNLSRTGYMKRLGEEFGDGRGLGPNAIAAVLERETNGIDARFYLGTPDLSELPAAYKNAAQVQRSIEKHGLADIVDHVDPYGCLMAGEMAWSWAKRGRG